MRRTALKVGAMGILIPMMTTNIASADNSKIENTASMESRTVNSNVGKTGYVDVKSGTNLNIRKSSTINSSVIGKIPGGKTVTILVEENGWYKVKYNGVEGYSSADYINIGNSAQGNTGNLEQAMSKNGKVVNLSTRLNVRAKATTSANVIGKLTSGQVVKLVAKTNTGWYKIEFNNTIGYVHGDYISETTEGVTSAVDTSNVGKIATVTADTLNVRSGNGTNYSVIAKVNKGSDVKVVEVYANGWSKVQLSTGITGCVNAKYLNNYREGSLNSSTGTNQGSNATQSSKVTAVINVAKSKIGSPYLWGAEGPNSFDCSGLTYYAFRNGAGISLPRTSREQATVGTAVSRSNLKPGDLVFFNTSGNGISHVGIYIGNDEMIHSPSSGKTVSVVKITSNYYSSRFVTARRIIG